MKIFNIDFSFNKALTKEYIIILILFIIALGGLIGNIVFIQSFLEKYEIYTQLQEEVERIETRINLVDSYKLISPEEIQKNNQFLKKLIPSGDTHLSMYYILDDLSLKTDIALSDYQLSSYQSESADSEEGIDSADSSKGYFQVTVTGIGTSEDMKDFLTKYMFITGRLLTLNSIEIQQENENQEESEDGNEGKSKAQNKDEDLFTATIILNYYTLDVQPMSQIQKSLSQKDITFVRTLRKTIEDMQK